MSGRARNIVSFSDAQTSGRSAAFQTREGNMRSMLAFSNLGSGFFAMVAGSLSIIGPMRPTQL